MAHIRDLKEALLKKTKNKILFWILKKKPIIGQTMSSFQEHNYVHILGTYIQGPF